MPAGIAVFTLFDEEEKPVCERLVMLNTEKRLQVRIETDKEVYAPGEKVKAKIKTTDHLDRPAPAFLSMGVVDEQILSMADDKQDNLLSYLMLSSELKGKIHEPSFYFDPKEKKAEAAIDYLLLTHGWRRFNWLDVLKGQNRRLNQAENIGHVYGYITDKQGKRIQDEVTIIEMSGKRRVLSLKTTARGDFAFLNADPSSSIAVLVRRSLGFPT